ncbi:MAG: hypothetical protein IJ158_04390 [Treponema sp.]|nr:hypothetical protein [Treponema sp.]
MILRKHKFFLAAMILAASSFMFMGCDPDKDEDQTSGVDFTNYTVDYSIKVRNNTSKALVAFKGNPSKANLIGGIPASATNHGLKKNSTLFSVSSDFTLFIVTEEDYKKYKDGGDFSQLANSPFARLYAYYNANAANEILYDISSVMGGAGTITLQNNTKFNVELRKDSIYGETIGYTAAGTLNTVFHVETGDYSIFPVFRKFDKSLNEIVTVYPEDNEGYPYIEFFNLTNNYELNALDWSTNVSFVSSSAFIYIDNQSSVGVSFYEGSTPVTTSTGGKIINRTGHLIFEIPMPSIGTGAKKSYASKVNVAAYKVGTAASQSIYITGDASTTKELEAGKMYTLTVTGENYHSLSCSFSDEVVDIDPDVEIN